MNAAATLWINPYKGARAHLEESCHYLKRPRIKPIPISAFMARFAGIKICRACKWRSEP